MNLSRERTIRAWKNPAFRKRLGKVELAAMPANPAGAVVLDDEDLGYVVYDTGVPCVLTIEDPTCVTCQGVNTCVGITNGIDPCPC